MTSSTQPSYLVWLAALSFLAFFPNTTGVKYGDAHEHFTSRLAPNANPAINYHGPVNTKYCYICLGFPEHSSYIFEQESYILWGSCFVCGALCIIFILWCAPGSSQEQPSAEPKDQPTYHRSGRTPAVAIGCNLNLSDGLDIPETPVGVNGTISTTRVGRGRQFASQSSNSSPTPTSELFVAWDLKEARPSDGRQIWVSPFAIEDRTEENSPVDQEHFPMVRYPVQAPQANSRNRLKHLPISKRVRRTPYLCITNPNLQHPSRGSMLNIVAARFDRQKPSLTVSLYGNPRPLRPSFVVWFILVIGVNGSVEDPEHDLDFWKKMLSDPELKSEAIYFVRLTGEDATRKNIEKEITRLFHRSEALGEPNSAKLFVYLTGEGDHQNRMCLPNEDCLSKRDIVEWLWKLRATWGYNRPVTLVLDICRSDGNERGTTLYRGIELISSCSVGQEAQAIRFESDQDMPYSCFFLALMVASLDSPTTSVSLKTDIGRRLSQLVGLIRIQVSEKSSGGPGPQEPDWSQAGDLSTFVELARMLSRTKLAGDIREFITRYFLVESIPPSLATECELTGDKTSHHLRGASKHLAST
ncbi:unnamed protein product [Rhizoctonia solani]|uniref:Uncharacterized protein n=1 Tax=Rhizoctonia solani TaxID=456999 RepID=A0A8H3DUB7_9AGAM|nr:unnamed protein product [Rhizoctonia solani]